MGQGFGIEAHSAHAPRAHRPPARYLIVIDAAGESLARLFSEDRTAVADFDASSEEVAVMTRGLVPERGAGAAEWDHALAGHTADERGDAEVYTLDV